MIRTRFYGMLVDPRQYRGLRGWWLNQLNNIRVFLEKRVALHILVMEGKRRGIPKRVMEIALRQAKSDPNFVPQFEDAPVAHPARALLRERFPALFATAEGKAEGRYKAGRLNSDDKGYERPIPIEEGLRVTLAQYERRNDRSMKYLRGRGHLIQTDGEGIEAVKGASNGDQGYDPNGAVASRRRARIAAGVARAIEEATGGTRFRNGS